MEKLLAYALSLPVSLASVGMPQLEHIERNAALARAFTPMSTRERRRLADSIESGAKAGDAPVLPRPRGRLIPAPGDYPLAKAFPGAQTIPCRLMKGTTVCHSRWNEPTARTN